MFKYSKNLKVICQMPTKCFKHINVKQLGNRKQTEY